MGLYTKSAFARLVGIAPASVTKAIKRGRIVVSFNEAGKERIDDTLHVNALFLKDENHQRMTSREVEPVRDPDPVQNPEPEPTYEETAVSEASKAVKPTKSTPIVKAVAQAPRPAAVAPLDDNDLRGRYSVARTEKLEHQAKGEALKVARTRGELISREAVYEQMMAYLDKLHANLERLASAFLSDVGDLIVDAGEVTPEHRSRWTDSVMEQIDETKKTMVTTIRDIAREGA